MRRSNSITGVVVLGVVLCAYLGLNTTHLGEQSFWTDELFSVSQASLDPVAMLKLQASDNHPPFYAMVLWAWLRLTHDSGEAMIRLVSLAAIAAGVAVLALVTWRRLGVGAAAAFTALALTSSLVASFAVEARMHGLAFGLICLTSAAWLLLLGRPTTPRRPLAVFAVAGGLGAITQYYALMSYGLEAAVLVGWLLLTRRRQASLTVALVVGASLLPVVAWLAVTRRLLNASATPGLTLGWANEIAARSSDPFSGAIFGGTPETRPGVALVAVVAAIAVSLLVVGWRRGHTAQVGTPENERLAIGAAALGVAIAAVVIGAAESVVAMPTFHYRSVMGILPVAYLGLAAAISTPFGRRSAATGVAAAGIVLIAAVLAPTPATYPKDDWRGAAQLVRQERDEGLAPDRIVLVAPWNQREWLVELNNAYDRSAPVATIPPALEGTRWIATARDLVAIPTAEPLLLVAFHFWSWDEHLAIVGATKERFGSCQNRSLTGITILRCGGAEDPPR